MTKGEAQAVAAERRATWPDWFCPLILGDCNDRCYSFVKASAVQDGYGTDDWVVSEEHCTNHALVGDCRR